VLNGPASSTQRSGTDVLGGQDFLKLLITQLSNQDPLDPMDNQEMLRQVASIREIELSTTLTDSLRTLTGQQRFSAASGMIGQFVAGAPGPDGNSPYGVVVGVRFTESGRAMLQLSNGGEIALEQVNVIQSPLQAAESMVGLFVHGIDRRDPGVPRPVEGVVSGARVNEAGEPMLELDSGESLRLSDVITARAPE
jgi:hypothetical protein